MSPTATQRTLLELKPTDIVEHPDNPRQAVGDVTDLAKSIAEHGIYEPLVVAPWPADLPGTPTQKRKHLLIAGARRLAGAKKTKQDTVPAILRSDLDTRPRQIEAMLIENLQRVDLTPVEEGRAYQGLLDLGLTQKQLVQELGQPATRVRDRLKLAKLDEPVQARLHAGQITITDALAIDEFRDDDAATKELMKVVGSDRFDWTLRQQRAEREHAKATAARAAALKAAGIALRTSWPKKAVDLVDVFPRHRGFKLEYPYGADERDAWAIANHKDCPGHVTAIAPEEYSGRKSIAHGCTEPGLHPKTPPKSKAQLEREKKDRAAKAQAKIDLAAAADIRTDWLVDVLSTPRDGAKRVVHDKLAREILREHYGPGKYSLYVLQRTAALLNISPDDAGEPGKPSERLRAEVRALNPVQLVLLRMLIDNTDAERRMLNPDTGEYGVAQYCELVDSLAYQWHPIEKAQFGGSLPKGKPAATEEVQTADASTDNEPRPVEDHELPAGAVAYETGDVDVDEVGDEA